MSLMDDPKVILYIRCEWKIDRYTFIVNLHFYFVHFILT